MTRKAAHKTAMCCRLRSCRVYNIDRATTSQASGDSEARCRAIDRVNGYNDHSVKLSINEIHDRRLKNAHYLFTPRQGGSRRTVASVYPALAEPVASSIANARNY